MWFSSGFSARVRRYFEKTGCLITVDGSFDGNIKPQGTVNYSFAVSDSSSSSSSSSVSQIEMESKYDDGDVPLSTDKSSEPEDCDSSDDSDVVHHSGKDEPDSEEELLQTLDECIPDGWEWMPKPNHFNFLTSIGERVVFFWNDFGWATGRIRRTYAPRKAGLYNVEIKYLGSERYDQYLSPAKYFNGDEENAVAANWAFLTKK